MTKARLPQKGDIIVCKRFVYGYKNYVNPSLIEVGDSSPQHIIGRKMTDEETVAYVETHHKMPPDQYIDEDLGVPDKSRGTAKFVVIDGVMSGGGIAQGNDVYPDGWHITARRLNNQGSFDPKGEVIVFYMTGCFINMIPPEEVQILGHMQVP